MDAHHLRTEIIRPTLLRIHLWSAAAEEILLMIAAHESHLGALGRRQVGGGPARGMYQMEGATHALCWRWLRKNRPAIALAILDLIEPAQPDAALLEKSDEYATAMGRVLLLSIPSPLPDATNVEGMAVYAKRHWNGPGKATPEKYASAYRLMVKGRAA